MLGVTLLWTSIPSRGNRNIPRRFILLHGISSGLMGHMARMQTFLSRVVFFSVAKMRLILWETVKKQKVSIAVESDTLKDQLSVMTI